MSYMAIRVCHKDEVMISGFLLRKLKKVSFSWKFNGDKCIHRLENVTNNCKPRKHYLIMILMCLLRQIDSPMNKIYFKEKKMFYAKILKHEINIRIITNNISLLNLLSKDLASRPPFLCVLISEMISSKARIFRFFLLSRFFSLMLDTIKI